MIKPGLKASSIQTQIRNALMLLSGTLLVMITVYMSRTLIQEKERETLESLAIQSERDSSKVENSLNSVARAVDSLTTLLKNVSSESQPGLEGLPQILSLTPAIKRVWIYRKTAKNSHWLPWMNFQTSGDALVPSEMPTEEWSIDTRQKTPTINLLIPEIKSKIDSSFKVLVTIDAQDYLPRGSTVGKFGFELLGDKIPNEISKRFSGQGKQLDESFRYVADGKEYLAFVHQTPQGFHLVRWLDVSVIKAGVYSMIFDLVVLLLFFISIILFGAGFFASRLSKPFESLMDAVKEVGAGNFNINVSVRGNAESFKLGQAMTNMAKQIQGLFQIEREKSRLDQELKAASIIQDNMLPLDSTRTDSFWIESVYRPAEECGGDWWQLDSSESKLLIIMADVTGHGVASALTTSALQASYKCFVARNPSFEGKPSDLLKALALELNTAVFSVGRGNQSATAFIALIDAGTQMCSYLNLGHPSAYLFHTALKSNEVLRSDGEILGSDFENKIASLEVNSRPFTQDERLFFYSDGVLDLNLHETTRKRKQVLLQKLESLLDSKTSEIGTGLRDFIGQYVGDTKLEDDVSAVFVGTRIREELP